MVQLTRSFRARFLLVVAVVAIVPLTLVGALMTSTATRSAEGLLRARLVDTLDQTAISLAERWARHRAMLLDLAELPEMRLALSEGTAVGSDAPAAVVAAFERAGTPFGSMQVRDGAGRDLWALETADAARRFPRPALSLIAAVYSSPFGPVVGSIASAVPMTELLAGRAAVPGGVGALVGLFEAESGAPLVPLPFDRPPDLARAFEWGGDRWIADARTLVEPAVTIVATAPLAPFEQPLLDAARAGLWVLAIVGLAGLALATVLTARMTGSLARLAEAAEAVAGGDLDRRVDERRGDEVGRVARAFNRMTASLRSTLQALADQRALARTGEFAASLAHEVRNPLTAIRVDLQVVQEGLPEGARGRRPLDRALAEIERLDHTVSGALMATRAARQDRAIVDVVAPLQAAIEAARKTVSWPLQILLEAPSTPVVVPADAGALEQLFLNLLLNACEAVRAGGDVRVTIDVGDTDVAVRIHDTGTGLTPEVARRAFDPLFTTREGGTGLGLTIAQRLARALDGSIELAGQPGGGAVATVSLPRATPGSV